MSTEYKVTVESESIASLWVQFLSIEPPGGNAIMSHLPFLGEEIVIYMLVCSTFSM